MDSKLPPPEWTSGDDGVRLILHAPEVTTDVTTEVTTDVTPDVTPYETPEVTPEVVLMLQGISGPMARAEIMESLGLKDEKHIREHYLQPALGAGLIEMTIPDKPRSRNQKYRLTPKGKKLVAKVGGL